MRTVYCKVCDKGCRICKLAPTRCMSLLLGQMAADHLAGCTACGEPHTFDACFSAASNCQPSPSLPLAAACVQAMAVQMAGLSEALALGASMGLDPAKLTSVINTSSARCWASEAYNPVPVSVAARRGKGGGRRTWVSAGVCDGADTNGIQPSTCECCCLWGVRRGDWGVGGCST